MRVDRTLLREMLEGVEQAPGPEVMFMPEPSGYAAGVRRWHAQLLIDEGYLTAQQLRPYGRAVAVGLTIAGQRLLDDLRHAGNDVARSVGEVARRVVTGAAVGILMAKARALGMSVDG